MAKYSAFKPKNLANLGKQAGKRRKEPEIIELNEAAIADLNKRGLAVHAHDDNLINAIPNDWTEYYAGGLMQEEVIEEYGDATYFVTPVGIDGIIIGAEIVLDNGNSVFIERDANLSSEALLDALTEIHRAETAEVIEGEVFLTIDKKRRRLIKLGVLQDPDQQDPQNVAPLKVNRYQRSPILDPGAQDDKEGKTRWRETLRENSVTILGPYENIPENQRCVVCFPGLGLEIDNVWKPQGFKNSEIIAIESDPAIAEELKRKYPGIHVVECQFHGKGSVRKITDKIQELKKRPCAVSIDPYNGLSTTFHKALTQFFRNIKLAEKAVISVNFSASRTKPKQVELYKSMIFEGGFPDSVSQRVQRGEVDESDPHHDYIDLTTLEGLTIGAIIDSTFRAIGEKSSSTTEHSGIVEYGGYEGNKKTQMYFAIIEHYQPD